jgi:exopolysaccharide production protein ExoQ
LDSIETFLYVDPTVIPPREQNLVSKLPPRSNAVTWCVAALLAGAIIGLVHDPVYATVRGAELVEDGRGIDDKTVMENGLGVAQAGRAIGLVLLLAAGGICIWTTPGGRPLRWDGMSLLVCAGLAWALGSILWSTERGTTARELVRLLAYTGVAAAVARRFDTRTLCYVLAGALSASVFTAAAFEIATGGFQPWYGDYRLTGSMHSNVLAVQAAVVALFAYAFAVRRDSRAALWCTLFVAATAAVYLTKARTGLITVAAGMAAVHIIGRPMRNWILLAATGASLIAIVLLSSTLFGLLNDRQGQYLTSMGRTDDISELTGRVPLWNFLWEQTAGHRMQGFGWGAFWVVERTLSVHDVLGWYPRHAHNAYLQVVVNVGLVGLAIVLAIGVWALVRTIRLVERTGQSEFSALAAVLIGIFVNGVGEAAFAMPRDMGLFAAAVVFGVIVAHRRLAIGAFDSTLVRRPAIRLALTVN